MGHGVCQIPRRTLPHNLGQWCLAELSLRWPGHPRPDEVTTHHLYLPKSSRIGPVLLVQRGPNNLHRPSPISSWVPTSNVDWDEGLYPRRERQTCSSLGQMMPWEPKQARCQLRWAAPQTDPVPNRPTETAAHGGNWPPTTPETRLAQSNMEGSPRHRHTFSRQHAFHCSAEPENLRRKKRQFVSASPTSGPGEQLQGPGWTLPRLGTPEARTGAGRLKSQILTQKRPFHGFRGCNIVAFHGKK